MTISESLSIQSNLEIITALENKPDENESKSLCEKIKSFLKNITVEPVMFCFILPSVMSFLATQNLNLEKACLVNLRLDNSTCYALKTRNSSAYDKADEVSVQKLVATMVAWENIIQSLLPSLILLFIGSWSDRHNRRKPCIILPIAADLIMALGLMICTYFFYELPMEVNALVESIPPALVGSWFTMQTGVYSYISSVSTVKDRTIRIGTVSIFSNISFTFGNALSGILFRKYGFYGVFGTAAALYLCGILYTTIRVKEKHVEKTEIVKKKKPFLIDFFDLKHIKETFKVALKKGQRNRKKRICVIMILVMIIIGPMHGERNVMYLFLRYKLGWNEIDYSIFSTAQFILHMIGTIFNLWFYTKFLKVDDSILGIVSCTSKILACMVFAFASNPLTFYIGAVVDMFNVSSFIALRSIVSKLVPSDELGKIIALFGVAECLMPVLYGPLYSLTYRNTINILPGTFFILGGILTLPAVFIFLWLYFQHKNDESENKRKQEESLLKDYEKQNDQKINNVIVKQ